MRKYFALALLLTGCRAESSGKIESTRDGDVSHPTALREDAEADLVAQCGQPETAADSNVLQRMPYLQQTSPTSTRILWSQVVEPHQSPYVEVRAADGTIAGKTTTKRSPGGALTSAAWTATVEGLKPATVYCYSLFDGNGDPLIERVGFKTAPAPESKDDARFVVIGDSGEGSEDQSTLLEQMRTVPFDFMLHVGDMAYDFGSYEEFQRNFFDVYEDVLRSFSIFPVPGNHEYDTDDAGPYRALFDLPNNERWYSFDWANVHFVALDTEKVGPEQVQWLEQDLARNDKPWTVAYLHKPPYSSSDRGSQEHVREAFSPLFAKYNVPLVLAGHEHHYERTKPQDGVHYIVTGGGGAETYSIEEGDFSVFAEEVVHFLYITASEDELSVHAIDASGAEFDQLVLEK